MSLQTRIQWEEKEREILAPYATLSSLSEGRIHPESVHIFRTEYQRDRDRIIHSTAFRRLEHKTQVVLNTAGDHFRTRLTHTIEVAGIARTIARTLMLNEDLAEAISLAHDLGHSPFGHSGENTLNELMKEHGGFEHNHQSLRIVDELETKYPEFNGLNLSQEVRAGIDRAHRENSPDGIQPSLEAQITDVSDEIAYYCHDLDDALQNNLIDVSKLEQVKIWSELDVKIRKEYPRLDPQRHRLHIVRCLIDVLAEDVRRQSAKNLEEYQPENAQAAQQLPRRLIGFSPLLEPKVQKLREFLYANFYHNEKILSINQRTSWVIQALFEYFSHHPEDLGEKSSVRIKKDGLHRCICDYLAGMTDRYALQLYQRYIATEDLMRDLLPLNNLRLEKL